MRRQPIAGRTASLSAATMAWRCWVLCAICAVLDALTTWYGVGVMHGRELNPAARWGIAHVGLTATVTLRVVVGCAALAVAALGATARLPWQSRFVTTACAGLLGAALLLWATVVVNNGVQILH